MITDGHIHKVIETLEERRDQLACDLLETRNCIATLKRLVGDEEGESETKEPRQPGPPVITAKKTAAVRYRKDKRSHYKGVREDKRGYVDGRKKYVVNYYDKDKCKVKYLGSFDNELLAAATYQKRAGNKAEAQRLRNLAAVNSGIAKQQSADMTEQKENNPNRPTAQKKKKTVPEWVCKRCGSKWDVKPPHCTYCNNDDFREGEKEVD